MPEIDNLKLFLFYSFVNLVVFNFILIFICQLRNGCGDGKVAIDGVLLDNGTNSKLDSEKVTPLRLAEFFRMGELLDFSTSLSELKSFSLFI